MRTLDVMSKRILVIALSLTLVLCGASLFLFSLNMVTTARANELKPEPQGGNRAGIGISGDYAYYIGTNGVFYKIPLSRADSP